jgi:hypothetical protein
MASPAAGIASSGLRIVSSHAGIVGAEAGLPCLVPVKALIFREIR